MLIMIGTAVGSGAARGDGEAAPPPAGTVAVSAFAADRPVFDSGAARGLSSAMVPLSGTGTPDAGIELRVVGEDGAPVTPWIAAQVGADGAWSAEVEAPLSAGWLAAQARVLGAAGPQSQGGLFGVGHVISIWQQSEHHHLILSAHDQTAPPVLAPEGEGRVAMSWTRGPSASDTSLRRAFAENGAGLTAGMMAMADTLARARPGEPFEVIWHVEGGTSWNELLDDDDPGRSWALDRALHEFATRDGQHVGLAWASWYASPRGRADAYVSSLLPALLGVDETGAPAVHDGHEHAFTEIYDERTRWLMSDPHRFDGASGSKPLIQQCREAVRTGHLLAGAAGRVLAPNITLVNYVNGEDDGAGGWTDWTHPAADDADGVQRLARLTAGSMLMGLGLLPGDVPAIDSAEWEPGGAWMEIWDSAGPLTTERLARGLPALDDAQPGTEHRTEVMGIEVNGAPAARAEIVAGRVRVYPPGGETFGPATYVRYGMGGATGGSADVEGDLRAGIHLNLPVRDAGIPGVPFVAALPLPDAGVLENPLVGGEPIFARSAAGPSFDQSQASSGDTSVGAGRTAVTARFTAQVPDVAEAKVANVEWLEMTGQKLFVKVDQRGGKGSVVVVAKNVSGLNLGAVTTPNGAVPYGAPVEVSLSMAFATATEPGHFRVEIDGTVHADETVAAGTVTGGFDGARWIRYMAEGGVPMGFGALRMWWEADPSGALPARAPDVEIGPDLGAVNAHPWKVGPDAT